MKDYTYPSEAALCAAFIEWATTIEKAASIHQEWMGWDILVVLDSGHQIGVQAKLRLNAEVILQAIPTRWSGSDLGPDYRAILVPSPTALARLAEENGIIVFRDYGSRGYRDPAKRSFGPSLDHRDWLDWNPDRRYSVPKVSTGSFAGSPAPISLTDWKLRALAVLAELDRFGIMTRKRMRHHRVDHRTWVTSGWLAPVTPGVWKAGKARPPIDQQHPEAWAAAVAEAESVLPHEVAA